MGVVGLNFNSSSLVYDTLVFSAIVFGPSFSLRPKAPPMGLRDLGGSFTGSPDIFSAVESHSSSVSGFDDEGGVTGMETGLNDDEADEIIGDETGNCEAGVV